MNYEPYTLTPEQRELLEANPQYHAVSFLDDGDLLICEDAGPLLTDKPDAGLTLWSVRLLTRDGRVHTVGYHYETYHDWQNETPGRQAAQVVDVPLATAPAIIDVLEATQHLLLKYRVDVTPRTVRNWLRDGKLAGSQLGSAERSPWFTTHDAIGQAATRDWFPDPLPLLLEEMVDDELVARAARAAETFTDDDQAAVDDVAALVDQVYGALGIDVQDQDEREAGDGLP